MNKSSSELNYTQKSNDMDRVAASPDTKTPTQPIMKRLLPLSWHGEKGSWNGEKGSSGQKNIPGPPLCFGSPLWSPASPSKRAANPSPYKVKGKVSPRSLNSATSLPVLMASPGGTKQKRQPNLLRRLSQGSSSAGSHLIKEVTIPSLYRNARKCQWDDFTKVLANSKKDIGYVYKKDGTTVLHMAVMSRTGYINAFKSSDREFPTAPFEIVEDLLKLAPELANVRCTLNAYTPLAYACLVCNEKYDVEGAAKMVRLFLKYCPESINLFTKESLSPVDIHIVSYSHHHKEKEDKAALGQTSTAVLRTLLTHSPELANLRLQGAKVQGPIELLYKCNAEAFSKAVMDEVYNSDDEGTIQSNLTIPERRQKVVDTVRKWWIWTWAVMILKYGSLKQKKRGSRFAAVHTAAMQVGCPTPVLSISLYAFPRQIKQPVEDKDELQNLPIHAVCSWPCHQDYKSASEAMVSMRKSMALTRVIEEYPTSVKATNRRGETPLELALKTGTTWDAGIRRLVKAYPKGLKLQSKNTGLYPFMTAAAAAISTSKKRELQSVRTIYGLLRSNPKILVQAWQKGQEGR
jgi:hypothetical protein